MWRADAWLPGPPEDVLELLTDPDAISCWSPIDFELLDLEDDRLVTGSRARVRGELVGRTLEFIVDVREATNRRLALVAHGPIEFDVDYRVQPLDCGSELRAAVAVRGRGLIGGLLARAAEAMLAAGALDHAVARLGRQLEPVYG
jgi:hypothetical protein